MSDGQPSTTLERIQRLERAERRRLEDQAGRQARREAHLESQSIEESRRRGAADRIERVTRWPLAVAGLAWLVLLIVVLTTDLHGTAPVILVGAFFVLWVAILAEYLLRLFVVDDRRHYLTTRRLEPALVAVPCFQHLRLFGMERVSLIAWEGGLRIKAILVHRGLHRVLVAAAGVLFFGSWLVLLFDYDAPDSNIHNYGSALWWGIVTMTTVGYGDKYPVTVGGRCVAVVLMVVGIGLLGVVTASVASFFVSEHTDANREQLQAAHRDLGDRLDELCERLGRLEDQLTVVVGSGPVPESPTPGEGGTP